MSPPSSHDLPQSASPGSRFFADRLWRELKGTAVYEIFVHRAVALWFLLQAVTNGKSIFDAIEQAAGAGDWSSRLAADLLARLSLVVFFLMAAWLTLVRSEPVAKAPGLLPRVTALIAVSVLFALPLLPRIEAPPVAVLYLSAALGFLGNGLAVFVLRWLGRSFSVMSEARKLVTAGPYRLVRHPLYVSEEIAIIGIFLPYWTGLGATLFFLHLGVQLIRLNNEEKVLAGAFSEYADYARRTAQLVPGVW
jgi:protein-S-isoprenylcysteine O-methyltransferase Ste14